MTQFGDIIEYKANIGKGLTATHQVRSIKVDTLSPNAENPSFAEGYRITKSGRFRRYRGCVNLKSMTAVNLLSNNSPSEIGM